MKLTHCFNQEHYVVTSEVGPPKGSNISGLMEDVAVLKDLVHGINVTDQQGAVMRLGSLAGCKLLKEQGLEPVFQLTCRDRNRIALQSDLLTASIFGVQNVLCLTGDHVSLGDHPQSKPVFDLDSVSLLHAASELKQGRDLAGNKLEGAPDFDLGCVVSPAAEPLEPQLYKLEKKVKAGAQFVQTQAVYQAKTFENFMKQIEYLNVPVMLGIVLLKSDKMARFMNKHVAGIHVPDSLIEEMEKAKDKAAASVDICARIIQDTKDMCQGVHIMALDWVNKVPDILKTASVKKKS